MCCAYRSSSLPAAEAQALGRGREAAGLDHQAEGAQLVEVERALRRLVQSFSHGLHR
jgi:hypothetical protein